MLILAACVMVAGCSPRPGAEMNSPRIICSPEIFTATAAPSAEIVHALFTVKNQFHTAAHVANIVPSCTCLTVVPFKLEIPADGEVDIEVDVDLKGHDGPQQKDVELEFLGVPQRDLTLAIHITRE
jgi:hypothetical protein